MQNTNTPKSMGYEWIGAAIAGAGTAAASFAGQHPVKNFRHAKELAAYNTALSEEMYNKYQSPAAQMAQYKEAGLNPYLVYNQQLDNTPTATPVEYDPEAFEPHPDKAIQGISDGIRVYQQIVSAEQQASNAKLTADLIAANTAKVNSQTEAQNFKNQKAEEMYQLDKQLKSTKLESDQLSLAIDKKYKDQRELAKLNKDLEEIENKKVKRDVDRENIELMKEKRREIQKNIDMMDEKIGYLRHSIEIQNKKYDLSVMAQQNANYWRSQEFGLKQRKQDYYETRMDAIDDMNKQKLALARKALGWRVIKEMNQLVNEYNKRQERRDDKLLDALGTNIKMGSPVSILK